MNSLNESVLDVSVMYFHGSKSVRKSEIDRPSYRYPFYITADLDYAMAFANKDYSSCAGDRKLDFGKTGYVYPVTVNGTAEFFDFRNAGLHTGKPSKESQVIRTVLTSKLVDLVYDEWRAAYTMKENSPLTDIWQFGQVLAFLAYDMKQVLDGNAPDIEQQAHCDDYPYRLNENQKALGEIIPLIDEATSHEVLPYVFERLDRLGYSGVITTETDFDPAVNAEVSTNYAVGIWDIDGFGLISGKALPYAQCEKAVDRFGSGKIRAEKLPEFVGMCS